MDIVTCSNPDHDHTTTQSADGTDLDQPVAMQCSHCHRPAHYCRRYEQYFHDDDSSCVLIHPDVTGADCYVDEFYVEYLGDKGNLAGLWFRSNRSIRPFDTAEAAAEWEETAEHPQPWLKRRIIRTQTTTSVVVREH